MVYLMIKELSPSADEVGEYIGCYYVVWHIMWNVGMTFICDLLGVGHHSNKLFDEGHE